MAKRITKHQNFELPNLGEEISFTFNGKRIKAFAGDSITSALIASGSTLLSRSFKYHRPRGAYDVFGQGHESLVWSIMNRICWQIEFRYRMEWL